jgi:hypothetical protein
LQACIFDVKIAANMGHLLQARCHKLSADLLLGHRIRVDIYSQGSTNIGKILEKRQNQGRSNTGLPRQHQKKVFQDVSDAIQTQGCKVSFQDLARDVTDGSPKPDANCAIISRAVDTEYWLTAERRTICPAIDVGVIKINKGGGTRAVTTHMPCIPKQTFAFLRKRPSMAVPIKTLCRNAHNYKVSALAMSVKGWSRGRFLRVNSLGNLEASRLVCRAAPHFSSCPPSDWGLHNQCLDITFRNAISFNCV